MRAVTYARFSSDLQSAASIVDQERVCRQRAEREGWNIVEAFADHAISGSTMLRPGYQALLARLRKGDIDIVLAESLDRISRDMEHIASFFKVAGRNHEHDCREAFWPESGHETSTSRMAGVCEINAHPNSMNL